MQKKFRTLSAITAGSLALTAVAISVSSEASQASVHAALAVRIESVPAVTSAGIPPGQLNPGQEITSGTQIASPDGRFVLQMQSDGNLVLRAPGNTPLGSTNTAGHNGAIAVMQADGNFVLRAPGNIPIWASGTDGHPGTVLQVQNDGGVVLYAPGHQALRVLFPAVPGPQSNVPSTVPPATTPAYPPPGPAQPASPNCSQDATQGPPSASIPPGQQSYFQCQPPGEPGKNINGTDCILSLAGLGLGAAAGPAGDLADLWALGGLGVGGVAAARAC